MLGNSYLIYTERAYIVYANLISTARKNTLIPVLSTLDVEILYILDIRL